jgi:hypothetical protein
MIDKGSDKQNIRNVSLRAIIIGLLLVIINSYWVAIASEQWYCLFTLINPFSNAVFSLLILIIFSFLLGKISNRLAFSTQELLVVYIMVTMVSTISGHTTMTPLLATLTHPFWFASPENEWQNLFWRYIPSWFVVSNIDILKGYFNGASTIHTIENLKAWIIPVITWSSFIFFAYFSLLCVVSVVRKQWIENEKLSYPIIQLPLAMGKRRDFFNSKLMWIGLAVSASIRILNGFHDLIPAIPQIPYTYQIDQFFTEKPWNAIGYTTMYFNLGIVGLTYFMPLNLSFSCWFFFWLTRVERVITSMIGLNNLYLDERASGGWIGIGFIAIWLARRHLISFIKHIFGISQIDDSKEPMKYRSATLLFILSYIFLFIFCYLAGMSIWVTFVFFILYYIIAISISKVRAELGPPYHEVININPRGMMVRMFGSNRLLGENLTILSFLYPLNRCNRAHPMPCQIESMKIAEQANIDSKRLVYAMTLAVGLGAFVSFWAYLQITYHYGVLGKLQGWIGGAAWEVYNPLQTWLQYPQGTDGKAMGFMGVGFAFVLLLQFLRTKFIWWPLYPSGYVLSGGGWGGMIYFWFPVMLSWFIKSLILKHGGLKTHRKAVFFFLGLVLGDFTMRSIWSIVSLILNVYMPSSGAGWN